jgi:hypothetical protein
MAACNICCWRSLIAALVVPVTNSIRVVPFFIALPVPFFSNDEY